MSRFGFNLSSFNSLLCGPCGRASLLLLTAGSAFGCGALTREEATQALDEVKVASQAQALTSDSIEIGTQFTIGDGAKKAAEGVRDFIKTQLPCAAVGLSAEDAADASATLSIEYGKNPGNCSYRGHTFSGKHTISVVRSERDLVVVDHTWEAFSNGKFSLDGAATVEWNFEDPSRHVVHDVKWTRLSDGQTRKTSGDRVQRPLDGGLAEGFGVEGSNSWTGPRGQWDLNIDGVEMRWVDPVPQAGTYTLDTPFDKRVTVHFSRVSETQIGVTITGPRRSFDFQVRSVAGEEETTELTSADSDASED